MVAGKSEAGATVFAEWTDSCRSELDRRSAAACAAGASGGSVARRPALVLRVLWGFALVGWPVWGCADFSVCNRQVMIPLLCTSPANACGCICSSIGHIRVIDGFSSSEMFGFYLGLL